ncbi:hypothetical protein FQA39_LY13121 [Lamprigera yunnana]|nr:hypothetical protein FQA39_LY13121 [Lamprigera yunnana]
MKVSFTIAFVAFFICCSWSAVILDMSEPINSYISYMQDEKAASCVKDSGVDVALIKDALLNGVFANDEKLKSYFLCLYLKHEILNDLGIVNTEQMMSHVGVSNLDIQEKVYEKCKDPEGDSVTDKMWNLIQCTYFSINMSHSQPKRVRPSDQNFEEVVLEWFNAESEGDDDPADSDADAICSEHSSDSEVSSLSSQEEDDQDESFGGNDSNF